MRFNMDSDARAKRAAKDLKQALASIGVMASLPSCQDAVAAIYGYGSWKQMAGELGKAPASRDDAEVTDAEAAERQRHAAQVVSTRFDLLLDDANRIVKTVQPTASPIQFKPSRFLYHVVDHPSGKGIAISGLGAEDSTLYLLANPESKRITPYDADIASHDQEAALRNLRYSAPMQRLNRFSEVLLRMGIIGNRVAHDARAKSLTEGQRMMNDIRQVFLESTDSDVLLAYDRVPGKPTLEFYNAYAGQAGRKGFLKAWPCLANAAVQSDFFKTGQISNDESVESTLDRFLSHFVETGKAIDSSKIEPKAWHVDDLETLRSALKVLAAVDDTDCPRTRSEVEAFVAIVRKAEDAIPKGFNAHQAVVNSIVATTPGKTWQDRIEQWYAIEKDIPRLEPMLQRFRIALIMHNARMPNNPWGDRVIDAEDNRYAILFLDALDFQDFKAMLRLEAVAPPKHVLEDWRPLLSPKNRRLSERDISDISMGMPSRIGRRLLPLLDEA